MSYAPKKCPACQSTDVKTVEKREPEHRMAGSRSATLQCRACDHVWEGEVVNHVRGRRDY
jgi:hypothetical protein